MRGTTDNDCRRLRSLAAVRESRELVRLQTEYRGEHVARDLQQVRAALSPRNLLRSALERCGAFGSAAAGGLDYIARAVGRRGEARRRSRDEMYELDLERQKRELIEIEKQIVRKAEKLVCNAEGSGRG